MAAASSSSQTYAFVDTLPVVECLRLTVVVSLGLACNALAACLVLGEERGTWVVALLVQGTLLALWIVRLVGGQVGAKVDNNNSVLG